MSVFTSMSWGDFEVDDITGMLTLPDGMEVETTVKYHMVVFADLYVRLPRKRTLLGKKLMPELPKRMRTKRTKVASGVVSTTDGGTLQDAILNAVSKALTSYKEESLRQDSRAEERAEVDHLIGVFKNNVKIS